jgi:hypothetical protein
MSLTVSSIIYAKIFPGPRKGLIGERSVIADCLCTLGNRKGFWTAVSTLPDRRGEKPFTPTVRSMDLAKVSHAVSEERLAFPHTCDCRNPCSAAETR